MKVDYSEPADKSLHALPAGVLRARKYDESQDLWQARLNKDWRFYFLIRDNVY